MPEKIVAASARAPRPDEEALHAWFAEQEKDPTKQIDAGAQQIIQLVTALYAVIFGVLAFASDPMPAYLAQANVRIFGLVTVVAYLVALLAALAVIMPGAYRYAKASQTRLEATFAAVMRRKVWGLGVALFCFALGTVGFAALFIVVLLGL